MLQYARERKITEKSPGDSKLGDLCQPQFLIPPQSAPSLKMVNHQYYKH